MSTNNREYFEARQKAIRGFGENSVQVLRIDNEQLRKRSANNKGLIDVSNQSQQGPRRQPTSLSDEDKHEIEYFRKKRDKDELRPEDLQTVRDAFNKNLSL